MKEGGVSSGGWGEKEVVGVVGTKVEGGVKGVKILTLPLSGVTVGVTPPALLEYTCSLSESKYLGFLLPPAAATGDVNLFASPPGGKPDPGGGVDGGGPPVAKGGGDAASGVYEEEVIGGGGGARSGSGRGFPFSTHIFSCSLYSKAFSSPSLASVPDFFQNARREKTPF